jgi:hypothetical protein
MSDLILCMFDGTGFAPSTPFHLRRARERFGAGELIAISAENERSMKSHRHYFAQSSEHLRRYLLIRAGYSETTTYACESKAEAARLAAAIKPLDEFGVVAVRGNVVLRFAAKSQSVKRMGAKVFQESKDAVLSLAETLVSGGELPALGVAA